MTPVVLDRPTGIEHAVASSRDDRRREFRDRGHQLRAARRRSTGPRLEPAFARSRCRTHPRRVIQPASPQVGSDDYDSGAEGDGGLSCLANGTRIPISEVKEGDYVYATDPKTGESGPREVIATLPHTDQLLTLRLSSGEVVTTEDHRYWNETDQQWQESQHLDEGDRLLTADGDQVTVEGLDWSTVNNAPAYDLTIDDLHTFYVGAGDESVLVHNCGFTADTVGSAFQGMRNGGGHAMRHLVDEGLIPNAGTLAQRAQQFERLTSPILTAPSRTFDWVLGGTRTRAFAGTAGGRQVVVFVAKEGPYQGRVLSAVVPDANQVAQWGL